MNRNIQYYELKKDWLEAQMTWYLAKTCSSWNVNGMGMNDIDANSKPEDTQIWYNECPAWKKYGLTELTRKWVAGEASNYGVIMWATSEDQYSDRDEKYFYSSEYGTSTYRPKLVVKYTSSPLVEYSYNAVGQPTKILYATDFTETNTYNPYCQGRNGKMQD